ncbi:CheA signal transduction histidine kinase [Halothece sp. PCC 7418]|uniref:hybrid sensor histidine kinase/response regulator n=1 Tax=Halothece sp. (strain PCC 7418) TaxID=65093 RepID=UPI0002A06B35|nr:hybrid sensor histidine kinase/response regulator [Halothece sp. PCC 7418]AFZ42702.1 CheA signal transduction histidine kinase [Halothece sp. PCC 7418]
MTTDEEIRQQSYELFRNEAPDLLEQVETGIYNIQEDHSRPTVHGLMRATHTLKGAAANVGRDTIKQISHHLEDVFGALLSPNAVFDSEVQTLLLDIYECLRVAYNNEIQGNNTSDEQNLKRAEGIFAQLQDKLGDCFDEEPAVLSSSELGFDMTQSVFQVGVKQRIEQIESTLNETTDSQEIAEAVSTQMEVFVGLAESLGLEGFKEIAQTGLKALQQHPQAAGDITQEILNNLHEAREQVLNGERDRGGEPSEILKGFAEDTFTETTATREDDSLSLEDTFGTFDTNEEEDPFASFAAASTSETEVEPQPTPEPTAPPQSQLVPTSEEKPKTETSHDPELESSQFHQQASTPRNRVSIRVDLEQVENLNHLVGELSINQNLLSLRDEQYQSALQKLGGWLSQHRRTLFQLRDKLPAEYANSDFAQFLYASLEENSQLEQALDDVNHLARSNATSVEREQRLSRQLRDALEGVRMLPIEKVLNRFPPMVRKLSQSYNKAVELKQSGVQVLVDKAITENLYDALLHIVRNAFDHGIESPQERQQQGKPSTGQIFIRAYNQGNRTIVEVRDDGRGLDVEKICQRALEKNLITTSQVQAIRKSPHPEDQLLRVLCEPGFSTVANATDLSGRGIGLDVVYSQMQKINGSVTVESEVGVGTTFYLQIRGALMNARLLVCKAGNGMYSFIADEVEQVLIPEEDQVKWLGSRKVLQWRSRKEENPISIPIYGLTNLLNYQRNANYLLQTQTKSDIELQQETTLLTAEEGVTPLLLIRTPDGLVALEIDTILEEQELVLKPFSMTVPPPSYAYGCTILPDGQLSLVVDGAALLNHSQAHLSSSSSLLPQRNPQQPPSLPSQKQAALAHQRLTEDYTNPYSVHQTQEEDLKSIHDDHSSPTTSSKTPLPIDKEQFRTLLVIDDSITERQTLSMIMQKAGHHVIQAKDGQDALDQLQQGAKVDLIVCDLEMPRMNGLEFIGATRQNPELSQIPVIVLTSRTRDKYQRIAMELGASDYLTKPYLDQDLLGAVGKNLE